MHGHFLRDIKKKNVKAANTEREKKRNRFFAIDNFSVFALLSLLFLNFDFVPLFLKRKKKRIVSQNHHQNKP